MFDIVGEIPYNLLLISNYNFWTIEDEIVNIISTIPTARYLIEYVPSEVILAQIFNDKIRFGKLVISISKPSIIIAPYYVIKTLKEWDLIIHNEKIISEQIVITLSKNICEEKVIAINSFDLSSKLFQKKLIAECGKDHKTDFSYVKIRELTSNIPKVMYKSEAEKLGLPYSNLNISVDFYISLFKNASKIEIETYEKLREVVKKLK
ncbi:hypothetical protein D1869_05535 [Sulfurisphaera ohwakuensis]|uniref:Uncharacterized protein n=1 Tax=Sulfurisphaera ohwakuensis TaxID=69656 RepID=A0A650CGP4_SULOH|nr:hypothetical protein D1869_05535 [Sulfurisphaera ohwakuensis]